MRRGRYSRAYLPHFSGEGQPQFVTWRLKDSLPPGQLQQWLQELKHLPEDKRKRLLHRRIEDFLDQGYGSQVLKNPVAAKIVQDSLIFGHPERYRLGAWSIMPTHVHCLMEPQPGWPLESIMKSMKGFTSRKIGEALSMPGSLWQIESFDRGIRSERHFSATWKYIEWNPVKAGLCDDPTLWPYSSANPVAWQRVEEKDRD